MKRLLFLSLGLVVSFAACDLVGELVSVGLPFPAVDVTVSPDPNLEFEVEETVSFEAIKTEIDDAGFSVDVISSLKVEEVKLDITGDYSWDKVEDMAFSVSNDNVSTEVVNLEDLLNNVKVTLSDDNKTATVNIPEEEQVDLKEYLDGSSITYKFSLKLKEELTSEITVRATPTAVGKF